MDKTERVLRVKAHGEIEVAQVRQFLTDFEYAYSSILVFTVVLSEQFLDFDRHYRRTKRPPFYFTDASPLSFFTEWPPSRAEVESHVGFEHALVLKGVRLQSPGFWDFLGKLNPLEVTRQYLKDRHERRKDKEYRESAEKRKLELENLQAENQVIRERIEIAKSLGATEEELVPLFNALVAAPLRQLDRHQDARLIEDARWRDKDGDKAA